MVGAFLALSFVYLRLQCMDTTVKATPTRREDHCRMFSPAAHPGLRTCRSDVILALVDTVF